MLKFREFLTEQLKDPEFKKEWDALENERNETKKRLRAESERSFRKTEVQIEEVSVAYAR